jgi:peptidoglycan/LPS O-acetylase OafA/YrhL
MLMKTDHVSKIETEPRSSWIPAFDGLRAIAVMAVIIHHTNGAHIHNWALGNVAVGVFFSLSGFLAYYVLSKDEDRLGSISYSAFLYRRILRIWPAYIVVIGTVWLTSSYDQFTSANQSDLFTFAINWSMAGFGQWPMREFTPLWSIAVEEQFYIVAPLMFLVLRSRYRTAFCVAIIVACNVARIAYVLSHGDVGPGNGGLYYMTYSYADTFLAGAIVAQLYERGIVISSGTQTFSFVAAALLLIVVLRVWGPAVFPPYGALAWLPYMLLPVAAATLLFSMLPLHDQWYQRLLSLQPLQICGRLSYGLYLVHVFAMFQIASLNTTGVAPVFGGGGLVFTLTTAGLSLLLASILYFAIEQPSSAKFKKYGQHRFVVPWPVMLSVGLITIGVFRHFLQ